MAIVSMKQLLEAGVHFGHQTKRWHPKIKPYIYGERNGIYIFNLQKTMKKIGEAYEFIKGVVSEGGVVLFVGTKKQAQESVEEEAKRCGMYYVNQRWLGGLLTNYPTIKKRINRLKEIEEMKEKGRFSVLPNKEVRKLEGKREKLEKMLGGIKEMPKLPSAVFLVDLKKERIAMLEARKLEIPVVAIVDSNCDPDEADYVIPGNDDAIRAIKLFSEIIANAVLEVKQGEQMKEALEEEKEQITKEAAQDTQKEDENQTASEPH